MRGRNWILRFLPDFDARFIVLYLSVFRDGPGRLIGRFRHFNTVDEVILMFSSPFTTVVKGALATERFNTDEETRRFEHCSHQNAAFPIHEWGYETCAGQSRAADGANAQMQTMQMASAGASAAEAAFNTNAKR